MTHFRLYDNLSRLPYSFPTIALSANSFKKFNYENYSDYNLHLYVCSSTFDVKRK